MSGYKGIPRSNLQGYPFLSVPRVPTVGTTQLEIATLAGDRFEGQAILNLAAGATGYMQFTMPSVEDGVISIFTLRDVSSDDGVYLRTYWDPTGVTKGAAANVHSENQKILKVPRTEWTLVTGAPSNLGSLIETFKSAPAGGGPFTDPPPEIGSQTGYRIYDEDRVALVEVVNRGAVANEVILTYSWVEAPRQLFVFGE